MLIPLLAGCNNKAITESDEGSQQDYYYDVYEEECWVKLEGFDSPVYFGKTDDINQAKENIEKSH